MLVYTNPGEFGTQHNDKAQINIELNPNNQYKLPGYEGRALATFYYNHIFAVYLVAAFSNRNTMKCFDTTKPGIDLNFFYNKDIPRGNYMLNVTKCYPFCCESSP